MAIQMPQNGAVGKSVVSATYLRENLAIQALLRVGMGLSF
jgi:hypothetical protein